MPSWLSPIWPKMLPSPTGMKVIGLINATVTGERENALFRKQVIEFESAQLKVEPGTVEDVIEADKDLLKVKSASRIGRREQIERDVLLESSTGVEIESAQVKPEEETRWIACPPSGAPPVYVST